MQDKIASQHAKTDRLAQVVSETLGVPVTSDQVAFKEGVLTLRVAPTIKMAAKLKQTALLKNLSVFGVRAVK